MDAGRHPDLRDSMILKKIIPESGIRQEVEHRAESELKAKSLEIRNVMNVVEVAVENMAWAVELRLSQPDSMVAVTQKLLADNEYIVGSAIAFEPYYYQDKGRQFSPYTYKHDGTTTSKQLGTDQYDYHSMEWYMAPMESDHGHWSEPYFDEGAISIPRPTICSYRVRGRSWPVQKIAS